MAKVNLLHIGNSSEAQEVSVMLHNSFSKTGFFNFNSVAAASAYFISADKPDIVFISPKIVDFNDYKAISYIKNICKVPVIFISDGNHDGSVKALKGGADNYIVLSKGQSNFKKIVSSLLHLGSDLELAKQYLVR